MLDWIVIGGGIQGIYQALVLTARGGVPTDRLRILDPHPQPLARWEACTANTGMTFLRSARVHHLGLAPHDLVNFAKRRGSPKAGQFFGPYGRPSLVLFHDHTRHLIAEHGLEQCWITGRAETLTRLNGGWRIETATGSLEARRVLLAISVGEQLRQPAWAQAVREAGAPIRHIFEPDFRRESLLPLPYTVVIGGGITAAQTALALARQWPGTVTLLMRHSIREAKFDSEPCWLGPACLTRFHTEPDLERRRTMICSARNPGSMPDDVARSLRRATRVGLLALLQAEVRHANYDTSAGQVRLALTGAGGTLYANQIILATGFEPHRPGGAWLDATIATYELPLAACGYPRVNQALAWADSLYVTGSLAELELGPAARNIAGARHAGERLVAVAQ